MGTGKTTAIRCRLDGIKFRSKIERDCYARMKMLKIKCSYESETIELCKAFTYMGRKFSHVTHTPDFVIIPPKGHSCKKIYLEVKGYAGDTGQFRDKQKLFLSFLKKKKDVLYFMAWDVQFIDKLFKYLEYGDEKFKPELILRKPSRKNTYRKTVS